MNLPEVEDYSVRPSETDLDHLTCAPPLSASELYNNHIQTFVSGASRLTTHSQLGQAARVPHPHPPQQPRGPWPVLGLCGRPPVRGPLRELGQGALAALQRHVGDGWGNCTSYGPTEETQSYNFVS